MRRPAWPRFLSRPGRRVVAVFGLLVLLPGVLLGVLALRTLRHETDVAYQQVRQRLLGIAERAGEDLTREFLRWEESSSSVAVEKTPDAAALPDVVRQAIESPGSGVLFWMRGPRFGAFPSGQLLYLPAGISGSGAPPKPLPPAVTRAESLEWSRNYTEAILRYRNLLDSVDHEFRSRVLHRLARTLRKAGRLDDAVQTYRVLERSAPNDAGPLPWSLIAGSEICSIAEERGDAAEFGTNVQVLYGNLVEGKWLLEKPRYLYYADRCRSWLRKNATAAEGLERLEAIEAEKLALTRAVEAFLAQPRGVLRIGSRVYLAFRQPEPIAAIMLSAGFLDSHWWPGVFSRVEHHDLAAALRSPEGKLVLGSPLEPAASLAVVHDIRVGESQWRLWVWPRDPAALQSELKQRQYLTMGTLIFVIVFLAFGSYVTARTVRRELEIARLRADFVSTVSHEFRSPLTGIRQLGEMLLNGRVRGEESRHRYYGMIVQESERLRRLVENILDFSRMDEGRKEYRFLTLETSSWLRAVVDCFRSEVAGKGFSIDARIPEELPPISADAESLGCAVHNLLDNAVKYSLGSKTVCLDARAENGALAIRVSDRGVGIPEREQSRIFDKFYRVDGPISQRVKGAGLGLSLVKHIVTAHGGTVECESRLGDGSTFSIRLPAIPPVTGERTNDAAHPGG